MPRRSETVVRRGALPAAGSSLSFSRAQEKTTPEFFLRVCVEIHRILDGKLEAVKKRVRRKKETRSCTKDDGNNDDTPHSHTQGQCLCRCVR
jgi:hypothetical protein